MPEDNPNIDALVRVIEELQDRIKSHTKIRFNETRTRDDLINPLLRALGWEGPSVITSEYSITRGFRPKRADYALHEPDQTKHPIAFIEAKRMNADLTDNHIQQVLGYARSRNVKYIGLTNGDQWVFYDVSDVNRPILDVSIRGQSAHSCAVQLLQFKRSGERFELPVEINQTFYVQPERRSNVELASAVDVRKVLARSGLSVLLFDIIGYVIGFRAAQPVLEEVTGQLGAVTIGIAAIVVAVLVLRRLRLPWQRLSLSWFWQIEGAVKKTLIWSCSGIVVGGAIGGILGYAAGLRTAQLIYDLLALVGLIVFIAIISLVMILLIIAGSRSPRRRGRRYYRNRSYRGRRYY